MRPPPDYAAAARRHLRDGDVLCAPPNSYLENADHLYGFAAECALLGSLRVLNNAGVYPALKVGSDGVIEDEDLRRSGHIREVWSFMIGRVHRMKDRALLTLFQPFSQHRDGTQQNPFRDWSVNDRYRANGYAARDRVLVHKKAADMCVAILDKAEQSYLKERAKKVSP